MFEGTDEYYHDHHNDGERTPKFDDNIVTEFRTLPNQGKLLLRVIDEIELAKPE